MTTFTSLCIIYFFIRYRKFVKRGPLFARFNTTRCQNSNMLLHDSHHFTYRHKHQVLGSRLEHMERFLIHNIIHRHGSISLILGYNNSIMWPPWTKQHYSIIFHTFILTLGISGGIIFPTLLTRSIVHPDIIH